MEYEGWTTETLHRDCAECDAAVAEAYSFAVRMESSAHSHTTYDDEGTRHEGVARMIVEDPGEAG